MKITQIDESSELTVLKVEGKLAAVDAVMLTWIFARLDNGEAISIDLSGVSFIDFQGAAIVRRLEEAGAHLVGVDFFIRSVIEAYANSNK